MKPPKNQSEPPRVNVTMDWVYGYKGHKAKNNIGYLVNDRIVYHTAAIAIVYDDKEKKQKYF
jgi:hypothetical protein